MAKRKGLHKSDKEQYGAYKTLCSRDKNRKARLERHLKKHPNDAQAERASPVKAYKVKPHTKGNFPAKANRFYDGSGKRISAPKFIEWTPSA